jgi:FtsH-binding integral membrane protein
MAQWTDTRWASAPAPAAVEFDEGLRRHMVGVYNFMMLGLVLSGAVAFAVANTSLGALFFSGPGRLTGLGWVAALAPLGLILIASFGASRLSSGAIQGLYWAITALQGVSLGALLQVYTGQSVARTFFVTAAAFGALSLYGYTTRRSLSGMGSFLVMGLVGIVLASLVNVFFASGALQFAITVIGVFVFAGLTAYDTQRIKEEYLGGFAQGAETTMQVFGALGLYLNFVNLFQLLLSLIGTRDE